MNKVFEDYFSELQTDMISICLENVQNRADYIYIYCSHENNVIASSYFYKIKGKIVSRSKLNDAINQSEVQYDVSVERQKTVTKIINDDIKKIKKICTDFDRPMPTEMRLVYDVVKNSLKAEYKYDNTHSGINDKTAYDIANEWFDSLKKGQL